jgi:hypothetical protein
VAVVDEADYDLLARHKWRFSHGYACRSVTQSGRQTNVYMHREVLNAPADRLVDHISGDTLDNRRANLRLVTATQNGHNRLCRADSRTGFRGVYPRRRARGTVYLAFVHVENRRHHIGTFASAEAAGAAAAEARARLLSHSREAAAMASLAVAR